MEKETAKILLEKYRNGTCTDEERAQVEAWYSQWNEGRPGLPEGRLELAMERISKQLPVPEPKVVALRWSRIAVAASLFLICAAGFLFYQSRSNLNSNGQGQYQDFNAQNDLMPGGNKATLTLTTGKSIQLSTLKSGIAINTAKLTYNDGTAIKAPIATRSDLLTLYTPRGGTYKLTLSDGTLVILNAASSLKFPASFASLKERSVQLTGEAYFIVKHNVKQPFKVQTASQVIEDIGTEFNVSAYTEEPEVKTTLLEGSVKVKAISRSVPGNDVVLLPGEQSTNNGHTAITVKQADTEEAIAWKRGEFMFTSQPLENIMNSISRWYDVEVIYENEQLRREIFGGTISRFGKVSKTLRMLELTGHVHFKIEGRRVTVMK